MLNDKEQLELDKLNETFEVHDLSTLGYALRKVSELKGEIQTNNDYAAQEKDRIDEWLTKANSSHKSGLDYFESLIKGYHIRVLEANPNKKTISTPYGSSKSRKKPKSIIKADESVILTHLKENGLDEYIKEGKESVKWAEFKNKLNVKETDDGALFYDENGQEVKGLELSEEETSYSVEIEK